MGGLRTFRGGVGINERLTGIRGLGRGRAGNTDSVGSWKTTKNMGEEGKIVKDEEGCIDDDGNGVTILGDDRRKREQGKGVRK